MYIMFVVHVATRLAAFRNIRMYHQKIVDHYENPRNVGSLDKTKTNVETRLVGSSACGDALKRHLSNCRYKV